MTIRKCLLLLTFVASASFADAQVLLYSENFDTASALFDEAGPTYNTTPSGPVSSLAQLQSIDTDAYQVITGNQWDLTEANSSSGDGLYFQDLGLADGNYFNWASDSTTKNTILANGGIQIEFDITYDDITDNNAWLGFSMGTNTVASNGTNEPARRYDDTDVDYGFRLEGDRIDQKIGGAGAGTISYGTPLTANIQEHVVINLDFNSFALGSAVASTIQIAGDTFTNNFTWDTADDFGFSLDVNAFLDEDTILVDNLEIWADSTGAVLPNQWLIDGGGSFNVAGNWSDGIVPDGPAVDALLGATLTAPNAPATVTLDSAVTLNSLSFSNEQPYTLAGPAALTLTTTREISTASGSHTISADVIAATGIVKTGAGTLNLDGAKSVTGTVDVQEGTLNINDLNAVDNSASGTINIASGALLEIAAGTTGTLAAQLTGSTGGSGDSTVRIGDGSDDADTVTISRDNSAYAGVIRVNGGTLAVSNNNALGTGGFAGDRTVVQQGTTAKVALSGNVNIASEVLDFEGRSTTDAALTSTGNNTWGGVIRGEGSNSDNLLNIESTSGTLTIGQLFAEDTGEQFTYVFSGAGNTTITGRLSDADYLVDTQAIEVKESDNVGVVKRGSGTLTIDYATIAENDYWFGPTTIEEGTIVVSASGGTDGELRSSTIEVNSGATFNASAFTEYTQQIGQELRGAGTINTGGNLRLIDAGNLAPGDSTGLVGTLTVGTGTVTLPDLGLGGGGVWSFDIGNSSNSTGDLLNVTSGSFTSPTTTGITVNVNPAYGTLDAGSYTIVSHTGGSNSAMNGTAAQITNVNGDVLTTRQSVAINGDTAGQVNVVVSGSEASRTWNGSSAAWDVTSTNWQEGDQVFQDLDHVTFDDSASGTTDVTIADNRTPGSITFANNSKDYTISGEGSIVTNGSVDVTGTGNVTLANSGNVLGDTTIDAGSSLRVGSATTGSVVNNGTLALGIETSTPLIKQGASTIGAGGYQYLAFEAETLNAEGIVENVPGATSWSVRNDIAGSSGAGVDGEALYATELPSNGAGQNNGLADNNYVSYDLQFTEAGTYEWFFHMVSTDGGDGASTPNGDAGDDDSFFTVSNMNSNNNDPFVFNSRIENSGTGRVDAEGNSVSDDPLSYDWYRNGISGGHASEFHTIEVTEEPMLLLAQSSALKLELVKVA